MPLIIKIAFTVLFLGAAIAVYGLVIENERLFFKGVIVMFTSLLIVIWGL